MRKSIFTSITLAMLAIVHANEIRSVDYYVENTVELIDVLKACQSIDEKSSIQIENCKNALYAEEYINNLKKVASEGIAMSAIAKLAISEVRSTDGIWGRDNQSIGIASPEKMQSDNVKSIEVKDGEIIISFKSLDTIIVLQPEEDKENKRRGITWACSKKTTYDKVYLPEKCRAEIEE